MSVMESKKQKVNNITILILLWLSLVLILFLLGPYLKTLFLAAIMAAISTPIYNFIHKYFKSKNTSSLLTLIVFSMFIVFPLSFVASLIINQIDDFSNFLRPIVNNLTENQSIIDAWNSRVPDFLQADKILTMIINGLDQIRDFLIGNISSFTSSAVRGFLLFFIFYYAMYFFVRDGKTILEKILYYIPMEPENTRMVMDSFMRVSKATLKGTLIIGLVQGILAGIWFWVAGIPGTVFWTIIMIMFSIIPVIGSGIVWVPMCIILFFSGDQTVAIFLALYCTIVVGSVDNILRPILVGKDTQMPELLILLSTLGWLSVFGMSGIIIWPVIAAFFLSMLGIYGETFSAYLSYTTIDPDADSQSSFETKKTKKTKKHKK